MGNLGQDWEGRFTQFRGTIRFFLQMYHRSLSQMDPVPYFPIQQLTCDGFSWCINSTVSLDTFSSSAPHFPPSSLTRFSPTLGGETLATGALGGGSHGGRWLQWSWLGVLSLFLSLSLSYLFRVITDSRLGFPRGSVFARTNLFPSFLDNICAYGSWFRMVDLALSVEVILWFDWCWVWLLGFRKHELLMLNSHWLSRVRVTFVCQLMRHILSWVTTRSSLLNWIFAAPGGQHRRLYFLIWFETLCASELFVSSHR